MKPWKAYIQLNGEDCSIFHKYNFMVSDELYEKMVNAVKELIPLASCDFYKELVSIAEDSFDLADYLGIDLDDEDYKPDPADYDDEDEYLADLEEWEDDKVDIDDLWSNYCLESLDIDDPGDAERFKKAFVGRKCPFGPGVHDMEFDYNELRIATYYFKVHADENSIITDITDVSGSGLESESVRSSSYGDCYPDYDFLMDEFEECFEEE